MSKGARFCVLVGGPQDGTVAWASGDVPLVMLSTPRQRSLLDTVMVEAAWNEELRWYEAPREKERET